MRKQFTARNRIGAQRRAQACGIDGEQKHRSGIGIEAIKRACHLLKPGEMDESHLIQTQTTGGDAVVT